MDPNCWCRPSSLQYPLVWSEFNKTDKNGVILEFQIQDLPEHLFPKCVEFMVKHFIPDEPLFTCLGFENDSTSVKDLVNCWEEVLGDKCTLICTLNNQKSNETDIVGIYILYYHHKIHDYHDPRYNGKEFRALSNIATYMEEQSDRYERFHIDDYLDELGLCVHSKYRGLGIATELLKTRTKLGAALGLKYSFTLCTAIASQKASERAGYKNVFETDYKTLEEIFPDLKLNVEDTPTVRYMYVEHNC